MPQSKPTRFAVVLFPLGVIAFVVASAFGAAIHWSVWLMLASAGVNLAGTFQLRRNPAATDYLGVTAGVMALVAAIGMASN